ncbi:MAG TPA: DUF4232 domain-containing protein [Candidatus Saccharimonadales bacterium]|nr:DUF4232 domain-containing protein [Candidatus Saccharimonadales bacterium]
MDMNEEDTTTQYTPPPSQPAPKKGKKAGKVLGIILLILVLMAGTAAGVYMWQQNELNDQKADFDSKLAAAQAEKTPAKETRPAQELTPPKVATETTCNADELTLSLTNGDGGGAGTLNQVLVLTNSGKRTCTLVGFPGVSLVNDNGNQIGSPADRSKNYTEKTLTLKPAETAKATVVYSEQGNFEPGTCKTGATKLRVYPPNDTGYLSIASPMITAWCPGFETSPVQ